MILAGENQRIWRETCPSATLYTTNPTRNYRGANPGLRGEGPAINSRSHGTAYTAVDFCSSRAPRTIQMEQGPSSEVDYCCRCCGVRQSP
jgi:hypothetical protein